LQGTLGLSAVITREITMGTTDERHDDTGDDQNHSSDADDE